MGNRRNFLFSKICLFPDEDDNDDDCNDIVGELNDKDNSGVDINGAEDDNDDDTMMKDN